MYLDFDDYRPDIQPIGRAISWREGILIAFIVHLLMIIVLLVLPKAAPPDPNAARLLLPEPKESPRFVFVQPRNDTTARRPPARGDMSDKDRQARTPRAPNPTNPLPFSRGNSPERVETAPPPPARGQGPLPDPAPSQQAENRPPEAQPPQQQLPESPSGQFPSSQNGPTGRATTPGGGLGDALRNLQRFTQGETFDNPHGGGGGGQFGDLQFDTKGVEFGPWVRRFIAQVKSNWLIPYAAMSSRGHVVITFNVHKDGRITDLMVVGPSSIVPFNNAAFGALSASNPTQQLPPEYPADKAFFTLTFFYNETPPR